MGGVPQEVPAPPEPLIIFLLHIVKYKSPKKDRRSRLKNISGASSSAQNFLSPHGAPASVLMETQGGGAGGASDPVSWWLMSQLCCFPPLVSHVPALHPHTLWNNCIQSCCCLLRDTFSLPSSKSNLDSGPQEEPLEHKWFYLPILMNVFMWGWKISPPTIYASFMWVFVSPEDLINLVLTFSLLL